MVGVVVTMRPLPYDPVRFGEIFTYSLSSQAQNQKLHEFSMAQCLSWAPRRCGILLRGFVTR